MRSTTLYGLLCLFLALVLGLTTSQYNGQWVLALLLVFAGFILLIPNIRNRN